MERLAVLSGHLVPQLQGVQPLSASNWAFACTQTVAALWWKCTCILKGI
jgi:hypothetical protein